MPSFPWIFAFPGHGTGCRRRQRVPFFFERPDDFRYQRVYKEVTPEPAVSKLIDDTMVP